MGKSIFDKIQAKLELFRLEQRYTRRRNRRSTFVSNAIYVDGEYVYQTPNSTGSSTDSGASSRTDALHGEKYVAAATTPVTTIDDPASPPAVAAPERKRLHRYSSMPGFGGTFSRKDMPKIEERRASMIVG